MTWTIRSCRVVDTAQMSVPSVSGVVSRADPYAHFKFRVRCDGRVVAGITNVDVSRRTADDVRQREGDDSTANRTSAHRSGWWAITLERGVSHDPDFEEWATMVRSPGGVGSEASPADPRRDIVLEVRDEAGDVAIAYTILRCRVSGCRAVAQPDASASVVAIETLTLENDGWEREDSGSSARASRSRDAVETPDTMRR